MKLALLALLCAIVPAASSAAATRPNLVVFLADDHGYLDSSVYGARDVRTPNMERLARDGTTFTHMFVASPSCAPSRAALLTGLMPARNGAEANHTFSRPGIKTLPAYLQELGYEVAAFGKVAHGADGMRHGFDHLEKRHDASIVANYLAKRVAEKPLCLFVGTHDPHVPWAENPGYDPAKVQLPPTHVDTPETRDFRARYYTDVTTADSELGGIYDLVRQKVGENTLFMYTSDHGAQWPFGKWNLYDAGLRVPLIAVWPGVLKPGAKSNAMLSWIDILPTFIELAGGTPPQDLDGRSFAGVLRGKSQQHRDVIFATHSGDGRMNIYPIRALRTREWKYILNLHPEFQYTTHIDQALDRDGVKYWRPWEAAAQTDARAAAIVNRYRQRPREELYDLRNDPFEQHNLASEPQRQELLQQFAAKLQAWMKQQGDEQKVFNEPRLLAK